MAEYIEREAAITTALDAVEIHPSQIGCLKEALREIPAADVRPVVLCKDCKNYMTIHCTCDGCCISDDWFCADGERKDSADMRESKQ